VSIMSFTYYLSKFVRILRGRTRPYTCAVILAAGSGTRMKSEDGTTKQMLLLCGEPVLVHSLRAFDSCKYIDEIVLVCKAEEIEVAKSLVEQYNIKKVTNICKGGSERSESAILGMACVPSKAEYVAFHDAARCLILPSQIADVVSAAYAFRASSAGCRVKDTVKRVNSNGFIIETPPREELWSAQTPQVFSSPMYRYAAVKAKEDGVNLTDDNMVMEHIGQRVKMVDTGYENAKLTTKEDLEYFEAVMARRKREQEKEADPNKKKPSSNKKAKGQKQ